MITSDYAGVAELADAADSKSVVERRVGSSPTSGIEITNTKEKHMTGVSLNFSPAALYRFQRAWDAYMRKNKRTENKHNSQKPNTKKVRA